MVDRKARDQVIAALQSYMDERITAFEFEKALGKIDTTDQTVSDILQALWCYTDGIWDFRITASKTDWDYFNRLLLLLQSDGELIVTEKKRRWTVRQYFAVACLILFVAVAFRSGIGVHLLIASIPFGLISMLLAIWGNRAARKYERAKSAITPFPSIASLMTIRRRVPLFSRRRYPSARQERGERLFLDTSVASWIGWILYVPLWLLFAPIPLLFQALPEIRIETRIALPA